MYKNMYKLVTKLVHKWACIIQSTWFGWTWSWSTGSWATGIDNFYLNKCDYPSKSVFENHHFIFKVCNKINPQVSLHRSIRLIWMNRKLMNRNSMNRKSSYRNWKRNLSWTNLEFGNFRRPILFLVSFDLFAAPTFWFFHFVREQHFLLHPILLLPLVLKLPNVVFYIIWMIWDLEEFFP